ncbi:hypothetical protein ACLB1Q_02820 [Escherichia coli]
MVNWTGGKGRQPLDSNVIASFENLYHGGDKGAANLGRAVMKTSAVPVENQVIEAPAVCFSGKPA